VQARRIARRRIRPSKITVLKRTARLLT